MTALKSQTGHLLGGSGGVETVAAVQTILNRQIPPTLNLDNPGEGCDLDYVPIKSRSANIQTVMNNSFGFGGTNASLVFKAAN